MVSDNFTQIAFNRIVKYCTVDSENQLQTIGFLLGAWVFTVNEISYQELYNLTYTFVHDTEVADRLVKFWNIKTTYTKFLRFFKSKCFDKEIVQGFIDYASQRFPNVEADYSKI